MSKAQNDKTATPVVNTTTAARRHTFLICGALAMIVFALFWPVRQFEFVNYDDNDYVFDNPHVQKGVTAQAIRWALTTGHASNWHPFTWISHMIDCQIYGVKPGGHHFTNVILHALNSILVFLLLRKMTGAQWRSAIVAALFAVHPLHVESVAWVAERKDVLSTLFWLVTTWAYVRYTEMRSAPNVDRAKTMAGCSDAWRFYVLALILFAFGLMSKPMLVTLPCALLLLDFWPLRRVAGVVGRVAGDTFGVSDPGTRPTPPVTSLKTIILEKLPFLALSIGASMATIWAQRGYGAIFSVQHLSISSRLSNAVVSYLRYIEKMVWPHNLAVPYPMPNHWPAWLVGLAIVFIVGVSVFAILRARTQPYLFTGWFWYLGTLVPVIGIVQVGMQAMADRYTYIPLLGIFIAVVWSIAELSRHWQHQRTAFAVITALTLAACAVVTSHQLKHWRNTETFFKHTIAVTEGNFTAHFNLANKLSSLGKMDEAISHYEACLKIRPDYASAHNNLGTALDKVGRHDEAAKHYAEAARFDNGSASQINLANVSLRAGKIDEAIARYQQALRSDPNSPEGNHNLGFAFLQQGKLDEAIAQFQKTVQIRPTYVDAYINMATALTRQGKQNEAAESCRAALRLEANNFEAHKKLGDLVAETGRTAEAIDHYTQAEKLKPDNAEVHNGLGIALATEGRMDQAIQHFQQSIKFSPDYAAGYANLGNAFASQGKLDHAIEQYQQALKLSPKDEQTHSNLGTALAQQRKFAEATEHFASAVQLNPDNFQTRFSYGIVLAQAGKRDEAIAQLKEALRLKPNSPEVQAQLAALTK